MPIFYMNPILIAAAVIPAAALAIYVYKADKKEKEPVSLLLSLIFLGIFSTGLAICTERLGEFLLSLKYEESSLQYRLILYFIVVAVSEEGFKYLLLKLRTWKSPAFNCRFDGIVYAVFVSLGFALWENISYVFMYGLSTALVRCVTAIPGHACFGVFMGIFYGLAKMYDNRGEIGKSRFYRWLAFLFPVVLHGAYDFTATVENVHYAWIFWAFIAVLFAVTWLLIRKLSKRDSYI